MATEISEIFSGMMHVRMEMWSNASETVSAFIMICIITHSWHLVFRILFLKQANQAVSHSHPDTVLVAKHRWTRAVSVA
jgi:hypothetical protein